MTDFERLNADLAEMRRRIAEPYIAELEEMLTAATDIAVQRGKQLDAIRHYIDEANDVSSSMMIRHSLGRILDGADGG